ncbi:hypothetical protein N507_1925 [Lacticaseibacillus rhamnosus DSM 14870]|nr:hypothetical protein N507_1925 [Lacticaseibacillus rhamnosus DSM 14870]
MNQFYELKLRRDIYYAKSEKQIPLAAMDVVDYVVNREFGDDFQ